VTDREFGVAQVLAPERAPDGVASSERRFPIGVVEL